MDWLENLNAPARSERMVQWGLYLRGRPLTRTPPATCWKERAYGDAAVHYCCKMQQLRSSCLSLRV
jgi:hypothetical protein